MKVYYTKDGKKKGIEKIEGADKLKNGFFCFNRNNIANFPYNFSSLETGDYMFYRVGYYNNANQEEGLDISMNIKQWNEQNTKVNDANEEDNIDVTEEDSNDENYITPNLFPCLKTAKYMFAYGEYIHYIRQDFPDLEIGDYMFYNTNANNIGFFYLDYIADDNPIYKGENEELTFYSQDISSSNYYPKWAVGGFEKLSSAYYMFAGSNIGSFYRNLPSLKDGSYMFYNTKSDFNIKPSDEDGYDTDVNNWRFNHLNVADYMFMGSHITNFNKDLPSLESGQYMFAYSKLKHFYGGIGFKPYYFYNSNTFEHDSENTGEQGREYRETLPNCSYMFLNSDLEYIHWYGCMAVSGESYATMFQGCCIKDIAKALNPPTFIGHLYFRCIADDPPTVIYMNLAYNLLSNLKEDPVAQMYKTVIVDKLGITLEGNIGDIPSCDLTYTEFASTAINSIS